MNLHREEKKMLKGDPFWDILYKTIILEDEKCLFYRYKSFFICKNVTLKLVWNLTLSVFCILNFFDVLQHLDVGKLEMFYQLS